MLHGIVLGKIIWDIDVMYSKFWDSNKYGVDFSMVFDQPHKLTEMLFKKKIDKKKYKFLLISDVWTVKTQIAAESARRYGLKIVFLPREAFVFYDKFLFNDKGYLHNGKCYFTPDVVLAPGTMYRDKWADKTKAYVTGHPRFDYCLYDNWVSKDKAMKEFGLLKDRKIIFFPSYSISTSKNFDQDNSFKNWGETLSDVWEERECLLNTLLEFSNSRNDVQVVVKLHPMSSAVLKKKGITKDIEGITLKYLNSPTEHFKVIDGKRETRRVARDLLTTVDCVVGSNSTMMFEGAFIGKSVIRAVMGVSNNLVTTPGYEDTFISCRGPDEMIQKLNDMVDNGGAGFKITDIDRYAKLDKNVCERICNAIKSEFGV